MNLFKWVRVFCLKEVVMYEATCVVFILVFFMFYCDLYEFGIYNFVFFWIGGICFLGYIRVFSFRGFLSRVILRGGMFS